VRLSPLPRHERPYRLAAPSLWRASQFDGFIPPRGTKLRQRGSESERSEHDMSASEWNRQRDFDDRFGSLQRPVAGRCVSYVADSF